MAAEKAIYSILSGDSGVTGLVSTRIYPVQRPQSSDLPAIVYQQISGPRAHNVDGPIGWVESRYQVTCWDDVYLDVCTLAHAVRDALDGYSGTAASLVIDHIFLLDEGDMPQLSPDNAELELHGKRLDFEIAFTE